MPAIVGLKTNYIILIIFDFDQETVKRLLPQSKQFIDKIIGLINKLQLRVTRAINKCRVDRSQNLIHLIKQNSRQFRTCAEIRCCYTANR